MHLHRWSNWEPLYNAKDMVDRTEYRESGKYIVHEPRLGAVPISQRRTCKKCEKIKFGSVW